MNALRHLRRPTHRLAAVLVVVLALLASLVAQAMWTPRAKAVQAPTMEVCSSSGVHRAPMDHKSGHHQHETCCPGAWLGLPPSVPVGAATPVPRQAAPTAGAQSVAHTTSTPLPPPRGPPASH